MRIISALALIAVLGGLGGAAFANDQARDQERAAPAVSADAMKAKIGEMGYDVERLKQHDDTYKVRLIDRESGAGVKAAFDSKTGELIGAKLAREGHETGEREREADERKDAREHESREHTRGRDESRKHRDRD